LTTKPTIPDVIDRFKAYHENHPGWGGLHIVLEDNNASDDDVVWCIGRCVEDEDYEGIALARILLRMSRTQRLKLGAVIR